jgi:hypothetical protein
MLNAAEKAHLDNTIYPRALAGAAEPDSPRNREIAASDYWLFLQTGGGTDDKAVEVLVRGLRACATDPPDKGPSVPWGATPGKTGIDRPPPH